MCDQHSQNRRPGDAIHEESNGEGRDDVLVGGSRSEGDSNRQTSSLNESSSGVGPAAATAAPPDFAAAFDPATT